MAAKPALRYGFAVKLGSTGYVVGEEVNVYRIALDMSFSRQTVVGGTRLGGPHAAHKDPIQA